jgi:hypothetical protein
MTRHLTGRCLCGAVSYEFDGKPLATLVCHCEDCQRSTGSAFSVVVCVRSESLKIDGELASIETTGTDTGEPRERRFCPRCGSPILTVAAEFPGISILKAGTLDDRSWLAPTVEAWRGSAQPWTQRRRPRLSLRRGHSRALARFSKAVMR